MNSLAAGLLSVFLALGIVTPPTASLKPLCSRSNLVRVLKLADKEFVVDPNRSMNITFMVPTNGSHRASEVLVTDSTGGLSWVLPKPAEEKRAAAAALQDEATEIERKSAIAKEIHRVATACGGLE